MGINILFSHIFLYSFDAITLVLQTIENKSEGSFLIRVGVSPLTNQEEWEKRFWRKYRSLLNAKDETINLLNTEIEHKRQENTKLQVIIGKMVEKENTEIRYIYIDKGDYLEQSHSSNGDIIGKNKNINNVYSSPELVEIGDKIQLIIKEFEQIYNPNTELGKKKLLLKLYKQ